MLDYIYHMTLKLLYNCILAMKTKVLPYGCGVFIICHKYLTLLNLTSGLSILLHGVISLQDATLCDKINFITNHD